MLFVKVINKIKELLDREFLSTEDAIIEIINLCKIEDGHKDWEQFLNIDYEKDKGRMELWLKSVLKNEPIKKEVNGLWFGLFNPVIVHPSGKEVPSCDLYISGNANFEKESSEWAVSPTYFPVKRYAESKILDTIYQKAYHRKDGLRVKAEYALCLAYSSFLIKELIFYVPRLHLLKHKEEIGLMVGFDSGDFIFIGMISNAGFSRK